MVKAAVTDSAYHHVHGLTRDPFATAYDEANIFLTPELQQRLDLSRHLLEFSQQVLLINGDEGVGKSFFCEHLVSTADDSWLVCQIQADAQIGPGKIVRSLLKDCPDISQQETETVAALDHFLEYCCLNSKQPVLFIDDAHLLDRTTIKFILQLIEFRFEDCFVRVMLLANEPFSKVLQEHAEAVSNTNLIHSVIIPSFTAAQTAAYVKHRLQACGGSGEEFSDKELSRIYKVSAGVAADINFLAKQGLSDPVQFSLPDTINAPSSSNSNTRRQVVMLLLGAGLLTVSSAYLFLGKPVDDQADYETLTIDLPPPSTANPVTPMETIQEENDDAIVAHVHKTQNRVAVVAVSQELDEALSREISISGNKETASTEKPIAEKSSFPVAPLPALVPAYEGLKSTSWLRRQEPGSFVLQLMRAREAGTIARFISDSGLDTGQLAIYTETLQGELSYVLVFGLYTDLPQARAAAATLPEPARLASPWPKAVKVVQEALRHQDQL